MKLNKKIAPLVLFFGCLVTIIAYILGIIGVIWFIKYTIYEYILS